MSDITLVRAAAKRLIDLAKWWETEPRNPLTGEWVAVPSLGRLDDLLEDTPNLPEGTQIRESRGGQPGHIHTRTSGENGFDWDGSASTAHLASFLRRRVEQRGDDYPEVYIPSPNEGLNSDVVEALDNPKGGSSRITIHGPVGDEHWDFLNDGAWVPNEGYQRVGTEQFRAILRGRAALGEDASAGKTPQLDKSVKDALANPEEGTRIIYQNRQHGQHWDYQESRGSTIGGWSSGLHLLSTRRLRAYLATRAGEDMRVSTAPQVSKDVRDTLANPVQGDTISGSFDANGYKYDALTRRWVSGSQARNTRSMRGMDQDVRSAVRAAGSPDSVKVTSRGKPVEPWPKFDRAPTIDDLTVVGVLDDPTEGDILRERVSAFEFKDGHWTDPLNPDIQWTPAQFRGFFAPGGPHKLSELQTPQQILQQRAAREKALRMIEEDKKRDFAKALRALNGEADAPEGAADPSDFEIEYFESGLNRNSAIHVRDPTTNSLIGELQWYEDGEIAWIHVQDDRRREGIASMMVAQARAATKDTGSLVHHSLTLTEYGEMFVGATPEEWRVGEEDWTRRTKARYLVDLANTTGWWESEPRNPLTGEWVTGNAIYEVIDNWGVDEGSEVSGETEGAVDIYQSMNETTIDLMDAFNRWHVPENMMVYRGENAEGLRDAGLITSAQRDQLHALSVGVADTKVGAGIKEDVNGERTGHVKAINGPTITVEDDNGHTEDIDVSELPVYGESAKDPRHDMINARPVAGGVVHLDSTGEQSPWYDQPTSTSASESTANSFATGGGTSVVLQIKLRKEQSAIPVLKLSSGGFQGEDEILLAPHTTMHYEDATVDKEGLVHINVTAGGAPASSGGSNKGRDLARAQAKRLIDLGNRAPLSTSKTSNWVARNGGLPGYMRSVARGVARSRGHHKPTSGDIATAIGQIEDWAAGRDGASAKTQAKSTKAVAQWEALRARAAANN
ncbi:MAG: hypothetical protein ACRDQA_22855 [Nocardioidaceae bacterium]